MQAEIKGNDELVIRSAEALPEKLLAAAQVGLDRGLQVAVGVIQLQYLDGPRPAHLGTVSGRLQQSIVSETSREGDTVRGAAGTNIQYAAYHEFGFHGVVSVKAHTRVVKETTAKGLTPDSRRFKFDGLNNVINLESRKKAAGRLKSGFVGVQFVPAHKRNVNYAGRPFVRPGIVDSLPMILTEVNKQVAKA